MFTQVLFTTANDETQVQPERNSGAGNDRMFVGPEPISHRVFLLLRRTQQFLHTNSATKGETEESALVGVFVSP